jgi:hypothetical protein
MDEELSHPSRRGVLVLVAVGALSPVALFLAKPGADGSSEVDGLRFNVLEVGRHALGGHTRHTGASPIEQMSWPDVVRVSLRVSNVAGWPLLVSPGQFRLRVAGLSVMPSAWEHGPTALVPGGSRTGWVDFRAPSDADVFELQFTPAGRLDPMATPLVVPASLA